MKEYRNTTSFLKSILPQIFVQSGSVPPFFQYFVTLFEFFVFAIFIASNSIQESLIFNEAIQTNLVIFLVALFALRYLSKLTIIKSIYVMVIVWNIQCHFTILSGVVYALLFVHVTIDVVSKIQFSFETKNLHSSTHPWQIMLHYLVMVSISVLRFMSVGKTFIFPLCELIGFAFLIVMRYRSIAKYEEFKNLNIRFYFLCMFFAASQFFQIYVFKDILFRNLFSICASQLLYQFIEWKIKVQFTVEEYISKKMQIQAGFYIFSFLYSKAAITKGIIKALKTLSNQENNCLVYEKTFKQQAMTTKRQNGQQSTLINQNDSRQASHKLISILKQNNSIYAQIFLAELTLYELNQHIKCRQILSNLKRKTTWYNILSKILINKIQKKLNAQLIVEHDKCISPHFYEFIENDKFRNILLKSALDFISLWQYTRVKQGIYKKINQLAEKVIKSQNKIEKFYKGLKVKCIQMNLLYGNYLFFVERNIDLANEIMENLYFYQEKQQNLSFDDKIYIKITIEKNQPMKIAAIGCNVNKHLGYERKILSGMNLNSLLPQFYKEFHEKLTDNVLENRTQRLFLFSKSTIIKHAKGSYETALICLRLSHGFDNELFLQGFIKINTNQKNNWNNYLFVKHSNKQIIECSMLVNDKISQGKDKKFNIDQFFDNPGRDFFKKSQRFTSQFNKYIYEPVSSFQIPQDRVTMFVQVDLYAVQINQIKGQNQKNSSNKRRIFIPQMISYPKYKVFNNIKHFLGKKISTNDILQSISKRLLFFVAVMFLMIVGIYILQGINIMQLSGEYQNKIKTMNITDNIVRHYMGLSKIGVDLSYMVVNQMYGYTFEGYNISLKTDIITVQETNQYFKQYSITQWDYQSLSSIQEHRSGYEFISEVLASASMIDQLPQSSQVRQNMIGAFNELFTGVFVWSYPEYTTRTQQQLAEKSQNKDINQIIKIVLLFILCTILYVFLIKVESSCRISQFQTLKFIGSITFQDQVIDKCKDFVTLITEEKIQNISSTKTGFNVAKNKEYANEGLKISQMSARQNTGRDLMGNTTARETWRTATNPNGQDRSVQVQDFPIKLRSARKVFIILPLLILILIITLQVTNYVWNQKLRQINESQSSKNIVQWMNKPLFFTRLLNAFLTQDRGPQFTDHDKTFYRTYKLFQQSYTSIATFDEINYSQFKQFQQKLRKIRFQYLCTYAKCPENDKDYINILYTTTLQKLAGYMKANQYFLNDSNHKMDTIMAAERIFRQIMTDLIQTYMRNYKEYAKNYKQRQLLFLTIIIVVLTGMFTTLAFQIYFNVYSALYKHFKICDIVKESSYMIDKGSLISFEEEELQRVKTQTKKKQWAKKKNKNKDNLSELSQNRSQIIEDANQKNPNQKGRKQKGRGKENQDNERRVSIFKELQKSQVKNNKK